MVNKTLSVKREIAIWSLLILVVFILPNLNYFWGWHYSQVYLPFTGRTYENAYDSSTYLSYLKQSQEGYLLYRYQYSPEELPRILFRPYWAFFGLWGRAFNASPMATFQAMRLLTGLFLLLTLIYFLKTFFDSLRWQILGFIFISAAYGFGWLLFFLPEKKALHLFSDAARMTVSFWSALGVYPHCAFSLAMMLLIIIYLWKALQQNNLKKAQLAGIFGLLLGLEHPFDLIPLTIVFSLWAVELYRQKQIPGNSAFKIMAVFTVLSWPALIYFYWAFHYNPVLKSIVSQNFTPSLGPMGYFLGFGIVLILAIVGAYDIAEKKNLALYPFVIWALLLPLLLYLPVRFNARFGEGSHIIFGFLAVWGLKHLDERYPTTSRKKTAALLLVLLLTLPTNFYLLYQDIRAYQNRAYPCFVPAGFLEGINWLKQNTRPHEGVLCNYALGNLIPAISGNRVFLGHWCETSDYSRKEKIWEKFLQKDWPEKERRQLYYRYNLQYLLFYNFERQKGYDPEISPYLKKVYQNPFVRIYKLSEK